MKFLRGSKTIGVIIAGALLAVSANGYSGTALKTVDINIQKSCPSIKGLPKDKKSVPNFSHKAHAEKYLKGNEKYSATPYTDDFTCVACHQGTKDPQAITKDQVCSKFEEAFEAKGGAKKFQNYFHETCKACHKAMKKDGQATGPVSCKGCHNKK